MKQELNTLQLADPDWSLVRPIYKKLSDEFDVLTNAYGLQLDPKRKRMLDHLIVVIDGVDQYIDELPTQKLRDDVTGAIIQFLIHDDPNWNDTAIAPTFRKLIEVVKSIVLQSGTRDRFMVAAQNIFLYTEQKRHTTNRKELVDLVMKEGRATAELPLSIMGIEADQPFGQFFSRLCMLMGVADLIVDARRDYKEVIIALKPGIGLYYHLNRILVTAGLQILWYFPKKLRFLMYVIRMSVALIRG